MQIWAKLTNRQKKNLFFSLDERLDTQLCLNPGKIIDKVKVMYIGEMKVVEIHVVAGKVQEIFQQN